MDYARRSLEKHAEWGGKIEVVSRVSVKDKDELSLAYTPGVASSCLAIREDPEKSYELTRRANLCLVITEGTAVLGLGDIGPEAGMPVMEGKCVLFKQFGGVDAFPLCLKTKDPDEFVRAVWLLSGSCGGINLEDISAPRCFEIERALREKCDIPVFHDDQHGTAVVALAGMVNALRLTGKKKEDVRVVINGAGAAGISVCRLLLSDGFKNVVLCDRKGILAEDESEGLNWMQKEMARVTNRGMLHGTLAEALKGADAFLGFSAPGTVTPDMVRSMNEDPIVFACANPDPEIFPEQALGAGARVVATGRSDYPNQINNVLAFPGIFRGAFDVRAREINEDMKLAASRAIASLVSDGELGSGRVIPEPFDPRVAKEVARAVALAARESGAARL